MSSDLVKSLYTPVKQHFAHIYIISELHISALVVGAVYALLVSSSDDSNKSILRFIYSIYVLSLNAWTIMYGSDFKLALILTTLAAAFNFVHDHFQHLKQNMTHAIVALEAITLMIIFPTPPKNLLQNSKAHPPITPPS
jgi:hypothetical protein